MIIPYALDGSDHYYKNYYDKQVGNGLAVYRGATVQRGHGIGGFFSSLFKGAMPLLKSGLKTVGKEMLNAGVDIARDALHGKNVKQSAKERMMRSGDNLLGALSAKMSAPSSQPMKRRRSSSKPRTAGSKKRKPNYNSASLFKNVDVSS